MSTATVIIILFVITLAAIGLIFFIQARERARIARARRLAAAEDAFHHAYRLLEELPPQYLSQELRQGIVNHLEELAATARQLDTHVDVESRMALARQQLQPGREPATPVPIDTPDTARYVKSLLESLFRLIERQHKARKLDAGQARGMLKQALFLGFRTQAELNLSLARQEHAKGSLRKAIYHYRLAAAEMSKVKDQPMAQQILTACRTRIQELETEASAAGRGGQSKPAEKSLLDEQLDELIQEEHAWKKRPDFES